MYIGGHLFEGEGRFVQSCKRQLTILRPFELMPRFQSSLRVLGRVCYLARYFRVVCLSDLG